MKMGFKFDSDEGWLWLFHNSPMGIDHHHHAGIELIYKPESVLDTLVLTQLEEDATTIVEYDSPV